MKRSEFFCVECGKKTDFLIGGLCVDCYSKKGGFSKIKGKIRIDMCPLCRSIKYKGRWIKTNMDETIKMIVTDNMIYSDVISWKETKITLMRRGKNLYRVLIHLEGNIKGREIREELESDIFINSIVCPTCSRKAGKYYEAIIQVRCESRYLKKGKLKEIEEFLEKSIQNMRVENRDVFIADRIKTKGGIDFYISDKHAALSLIYLMKGQFGGEIKKSPKLIGMKDGQRQYRMTYLLRIPNYTRGDVILRGEDLFYIKRFSSDGIKVIDLKKWKEYNFRHKDIKGCKVLNGKDNIREAVVVNQRGREAMILDPDNYKIADIVIPIDTILGETVKIVKYRGDFFVIPGE